MLIHARKYWTGFKSRRRFIAGMFLGSMVGTATYLRFWESGWVEVTRRQLPIAPNQKPIRVLHLSDLHASRVVSLGYLERAFEIGLEQKPDLICLTGDFITWKYNQFDEYADVMRSLSEAAPTFACLGNHDGGTWSGRSIGYSDSEKVRTLLKQANVQLLHNRMETIQIGDRTLEIAGLGDIWNNECEPEQVLNGEITEGARRIVLSHNPDSKERLLRFNWDLMLSGHTHGGQLYLPGIGAPFAPVRDKRYVRGLHEIHGRWLNITKGLGNLHGVRLNCSPEISVLEV